MNYQEESLEKDKYYIIMRTDIGEVVSAFKDLESYVWNSFWTRSQFLDGFQKRVSTEVWSYVMLHCVCCPLQT